jgi:hypothetical protein
MLNYTKCLLQSFCPLTLITNLTRQIRSSLFGVKEQCQLDAKSPQTAKFDFEYSAHAKFLQQTEDYKTFTHAIKLAYGGP